MDFTENDINYLLSPLAIRERTKMIFDLAESGKTNFQVNLSQLDYVSSYVLDVIRINYPDLKIPFHSRHGHLNAGNINRIKQLEEKLAAKTPLEVAKSKIDLVVISVLLDAGAGDTWKYTERQTKETYARSEGLAVASFQMFMTGAFSSEKNFPWQADIMALKSFYKSRLESHFQVTAENTLVGVEGRVYLLNQLAKVIEKNPDVFKTGRVSDLLDYLIAKSPGGKSIAATSVLDFVLRFFGDIWPARIRLGKQSLGDVWSHPGLGKAASVESLVPFHKLSQWLTYSILVPIIEMGLEVTAVEELTGLAEYRNGGLLIDGGLIELRNPFLLTQKHAPHTPVVIEWRALTIVLLDMIADKIREKLHMTKEELPLARVLEGGTWHAGRKIAKEKRPSGSSPLGIISDGTVF